jgi:outer membrane receptor protein involved in Fe transport
MFSQNFVSGKVVNQYNEPLPGVKVKVNNTNKETMTDFDGVFIIQIEKFPVTLKFSLLGYNTIDMLVDENNVLKVVLTENNQPLENEVSTASRTTEKIIESPVSIEQMGIKDIENRTNFGYYQALSNLKGVNVNEVSISFQSANSRGFSSLSNFRIKQLIDGMNNNAPSLGFPLGNFFGINEADIQSIEVLPGAGSALYGADAFNGLINITSKNPFEYKGLSAFVYQGVTKQEFDDHHNALYAGLRYAFGGNKLAAKFNFSYRNGTNWVAEDITDIDTHLLNLSLKGSRISNPSYDGLNIYGDEVSLTRDLSHIFDGTPYASLNLNEKISVSRTGYQERFLNDDKDKNLKMGFGLYYRPKGIPETFEMSWQSRVGLGKTVFQGTNRYVLDNYVLQQHQFKMKNKNWNIRAGFTVENSGNSYDTRLTAWNINKSWRSDKDWFNDYFLAYTTARKGVLGQVLSPADAHNFARNFADNGNSYSQLGLQNASKPTRIIPGTIRFDKAFNQVINDSNLQSGSHFVAKSNVMDMEANYDFKNLIHFAEIQIGGSLSRVNLHSDGTLFTDYSNLSPIKIDEYGGYFQISKKNKSKRLKISASIRYDKQMDEVGNYSPRFSLVYAAGKEKNHNFRLSYQTGYRNPNARELFSGINLGAVTILGGGLGNEYRYQETVSAFDQANNNPYDVTVTGEDAYHNAYTLSSFKKYQQSQNPADLVKSHLDEVDPEEVQNFDFGYRGIFSEHFSFDFGLYYNMYDEFVAIKNVVAISSQVGSVSNLSSAVQAINDKAYKPFKIYSNYYSKVYSYGLDAGAHFNFGDYNLKFIYDYAKYDFNLLANEKDFKPAFNTPEHQFKFSFSNDKLFKNFGFRIDYKYHTSFYWHGAFADGLVPERHLVDAQFTYHIKKYKTKLKLGGTNLSGKNYMVAPGSGYIGSLFYLALIYGK